MSCLKIFKIYNFMHIYISPPREFFWMLHWSHYHEIHNLALDPTAKGHPDLEWLGIKRCGPQKDSDSLSLSTPK